MAGAYRSSSAADNSPPSTPSSWADEFFARLGEDGGEQVGEGERGVAGRERSAASCMAAPRPCCPPSSKKGNPTDGPAPETGERASGGGGGGSGGTRQTSPCDGAALKAICALGAWNPSMPKVARRLPGFPVLALPALATPSVTMEEAATSPACVSLLVLHIGNGHDFLVLRTTATRGAHTDVSS